MEKKKSQFLRTVAGKTVLFIVINLSLIIGFLCVASGVAAVYEDIYGKTEDEYYAQREEQSIQQLAVLDAYRLVTNQYNGIELMPLKITAPDGTLIAATPDFDLASESAGVSGKYQNYTLYTFRAQLICSPDGDISGIYGYTPYDASNDDVRDVEIQAYANSVTYNSYSYLETKGVHLLFSVKYLIYPVGIICFFLILASFIALMCVAGKQPGSETVTLGPLGKFPFDVLLLGALLAGIFAIVVVDSATGFAEAFFAVVVAIAAINCFLGLCVSLAARVKLKVLIKDTLTYKIIKLIGKGFKLLFRAILSIPIVWQVVVAMAAISFIELIVIAATGADRDAMSIAWLFEKLILCPVIFYIALMMKKLKTSGEKMAQGDINYRTNTKWLFGDFKKHANNLNAVADSVTIAVEDRLKSERMKTELITNVSHDIKTPLTSIINYASLIGNAEPDDPKLDEYSEVIVRQSEKLKRLIEDLVEASKASSGNLEIVPAPLDCCTFISQTAGEYKERLEGCSLTLVTTTPEESVTIMADGRRMMRIYDNLMNNICKYSQPGTRVYLTLEKKDGKAVTTFKNTSSAELNISPDELVERFVRGDQSRNTEGNGLGLSIAKSMTELQGGTFDIAIDGDLFKVTLSFPVIG
jgi:signal transduction histidine kinase